MANDTPIGLAPSGFCTLAVEGASMDVQLIPTSDSVWTADQIDMQVQCLPTLFGGVMVFNGSSTLFGESCPITIEGACSEEEAKSIVTAMTNSFGKVVKATLTVQTDAIQLFLSRVSYKKTLQYGKHKVKLNISGFIFNQQRSE